MNDHIQFTYEERLSSNRTTALFIALTLIFFLLFLWRMTIPAPATWAVVFGIFAALFLFYTINYRTLKIRISPVCIQLNFGIFTWVIPLENIAGCRIDSLPPMMEYGGAGIHFMVINQRYRASLNFLEYPRVVVSLKKNQGLVRDVSFSTSHPEEVLSLIQSAAREYIDL